MHQNNIKVPSVLKGANQYGEIGARLHVGTLSAHREGRARGKTGRVLKSPLEIHATNLQPAFDTFLL